MDKPDQIVTEKVIGFKLKCPPYKLTMNKAILYNLSVGYSKDPVDRKDLEFTYEFSEEFKVSPTMGCVQLEIEVMFNALKDCPGIPDFNPMMLLHGEESLTLHQQFEPDTEYFIDGEIVDCMDKKKGAVIVILCKGYSNQSKTDLVYELIMTTYIRGMGGYDKSNRKHKKWVAIPRPIKRKPDFILSQKTDPNQALYYRLNGDMNPLHADPDMAAMGGFSRPILHGLCTYGISSKLMIEKVCGNNPEKFKRLNGRFTSHVFPGDTLELMAWRTGPNSFVFATQTKERGKIVLIGTFETKNEINPKL